MKLSQILYKTNLIYQKSIKGVIVIQYNVLHTLQYIIKQSYGEGYFNVANNNPV